MQLLSRHFLTFIPIAKYWAVINILIILPSKTTLFDYFLNTRVWLLSWIGNGWTSSVSLTVTCSLQRCFDISEKSGSFDLKRFPTITTYKANQISKQKNKQNTLWHTTCVPMCVYRSYSHPLTNQGHLGFLMFARINYGKTRKAFWRWWSLQVWETWWRKCGQNVLPEDEEDVGKGRKDIRDLWQSKRIVQVLRREVSIRYFSVFI